jgi:hypothetical protein
MGDESVRNLIRNSIGGTSACSPFPFFQNRPHSLVQRPGSTSPLDSGLSIHSFFCTWPRQSGTSLFDEMGYWIACYPSGWKKAELPACSGRAWRSVDDVTEISGGDGLPSHRIAQRVGANAQRQTPSRYTQSSRDVPAITLFTQTWPPGLPRVSPMPALPGGHWRRRWSGDQAA